MLQWFLRFSEFAEFMEFSESSAAFRENPIVYDSPFQWEKIRNYGWFTLHGTGTIEDTGSGSCPCLSAVWTVQ